MLEGQTFAPAAPKPPIALLRALPAGRMAEKYRKLQHLAEMFAAFDRDDMELAVELLLAEMDASDGDPDLEDGDEDRCTGRDDDLDVPGIRMGDEYGSLGDCEDCEPMLGAPEAVSGHWATDSDASGRCSHDDEDDDYAGRKRHIDRIRRTRCEVETVRGYGWTRSTFRLLDQVQA